MPYKKEKYKLAVVQMDCGFKQAERNLEKAERFIREAAKEGAAIVCLPEAFNTGYLSTEIGEMAAYAEDMEGRSVTQLKSLAAELGIWLVVPVIIRNGECKAENTAVLIKPDGEILGTYSKTHLVGDERKLLKRGESYPVWETELGRIGILICYDICFPETSRRMALCGADVIIVPAAWRAGSYFKEWWDLNLACRALDNLVYIAAANRCGASGNEMFAGKSQIISPIGSVLGSLETCGEGILCCEIDLGALRKEREFNTVMQDRHPEDYKMLSQKK